jgi:hypothetical protein
MFLVRLNVSDCYFALEGLYGEVELVEISVDPVCADGDEKFPLPFWPLVVRDLQELSHTLHLRWVSGGIIVYKLSEVANLRESRGHISRVDNGKPCAITTTRVVETLKALGF